MKKRRTHSRGARWTRGLFAGFLAALVMLIVAANALPKPAANGDIEAILKQAQQDRAARAAAAAQARQNLPADAPIPPDWDYRPILGAFKDHRLEALMNLASSCVNEPEGVSADSAERIRDALERKRHARPDNAFYFSFSWEPAPCHNLRDLLCEFLRNSRPLQEIEAAQKLGLLQDIADAYRNPLESNLVNIAVLFAARASCELAGGDAPRALETLLAGYAIAERLADWPHAYGPSNRYYADRMLDRVLWLVCDAGPITVADQQRVLNALDGRTPVNRLTKTLLVHAANLEIGEESDHRGYPKPVDVAFAFTGRGALSSARQLVPLLTTPPWQARELMEDIGKHRAAGYWVNRFVDNAIQDYKMHAREAMMGDMARLAFALKQWRQEHDTYPASLEELQPFPLPEPPREPLTGDPIQYESGGASFRLTGPSDDTLWVEQYWIATR